jgi:hypothetical protein
VPCAQVTDLAGELDDLGGVGEGELADGDGFDGADLNAAVAAVAGAVKHGHVVPGQPLATCQQGGLVSLDGEHVVGMLAVDQQVGGVSVGVQRVGGDDGAGKVQVGQQRRHAGDFTGGAVDLLLGQDGAGGVVHGGQQVDPPAVTDGTAEGLAIDRDRPSALVRAIPVGQPCAEHRAQLVGVDTGQGPADRRLGRHDPAGRALAAGAQRGTNDLRGVGGPFGDRGHRAGAGQDCRGGQG